MQFNSHPDEEDIVSAVNTSTGLHKVAELKTITRAVNEANRLIWAWIFEAYGGWQYDDGNQTTLPSAVAALVSGQQKYTIPADAISVRQVSVKDASGIWRDVNPMTTEQIHQSSEETEFYKTAGQPMFYRLVSNVINIYPAPNYSQPASIRIQFDRGAVAFTSTDTTKTPGFVSEFHGAIATGASYIISCDRTLDNHNTLRDRWATYERNIKEYYKARFVEMNPTEKLVYQSDPLVNLH